MRARTADHDGARGGIAQRVRDPGVVGAPRAGAIERAAREGDRFR
jgi:hypothetical protein